MRKRGFEIAMSVLAVLLLGAGFFQVVSEALNENRVFEAKLAANVPFMKITRALSLPKFCQAQLLSSFQKYTADSEFGKLELNGLQVSLKRSSRPAKTENLVMADLTIPIGEFRERKVPIMLKHDAENKIINCMVDYHTAHLELGASSLVTPACIPAPQNTTWYLRCPPSTYLSREPDGKNFKCCPLERS